MSLDKTFDGSDAHLMPADAAACVAFLRGYQAWRRFDGEIDEEGPAMPHPKSIGFAIDMAIELIEQRDELLRLVEKVVASRCNLGAGWSLMAHDAIVRARGSA